MKILLSLPKVTELKLKLAQDNIQKTASLSSNSLTKEMANLVVKAMDYDPIEVNYKDLEFFHGQFATTLEDLIVEAAEDPRFDLDSQIFWFVFQIYALQFEVTSLKNKFNSDEIQLGAFLQTNISRFEPDIQQRIQYLSYKLGVDIANRKIAGFAKQQLDSIGSKADEAINAANKIEGWSTQLDNWEKRVNYQQEKLKSQLVKLNFVGLSNAFLNIIKEKKWEKRVHALISTLLGVMLALTPISLLFFKKDLTDIPIEFNNIYSIAPVAALEFVLFYLFRVSLQNYSSAKAQLLQLRLRYELCAFVEGYSEFIEPIRQKSGAETLSKFESIIFSGISPDPQNVPSQFDGLESLLKFIKTAKSE